jgi:thiamine biosynthesis lipoprotein
MGTVFSIDIRPPGVDQAALDSVITWLHWVDATFSTYRQDSQISRLGRGELSLAECAPEVTEILDRCAELEAETAGYFSAWIGGSLDPVRPGEGLGDPTRQSDPARGRLGQTLRQRRW